MYTYTTLGRRVLVRAEKGCESTPPKVKDSKVRTERPAASRRNPFPRKSQWWKGSRTITCSYNLGIGSNTV